MGGIGPGEVGVGKFPPTGGMIVGCHGSGHTRLREQEWVLTLTVCTRQLFLSKESAGFNYWGCHDVTIAYRQLEG